jgi:SRSO17 transposase
VARHRPPTTYAKLAYRPEELQFKTKNELGVELLERAVGWEIARAPVLGDQAYGDDSKLRERLDAAGSEYVLSVGPAGLASGVWAGGARAPAVFNQAAKWAPGTRLHDYERAPVDSIPAWDFGRFNPSRPNDTVRTTDSLKKSQVVCSGVTV